ncbi:class I adenylate-forming enzyme family protein [Shimia aestuarii]|uniref:3-methylmercaptopropionyl-CoA ligase n=1 Tax=Shimia aestuarii TaxID=254406 RepID=A0A1I4QVF2_9RHOB|nr:AMP-binding protein [Shimia aestuarii]SFM43991.1 long-chain acyl-CoA synthetase [Shimia aestuarii]
MNIASWLERTARLDPERPAIFLGEDSVETYGSFHAKALSVAGWLRTHGIAPGDRVGIFMKNLPEYLIAQYGAWYAGAVVVPINAKLHGREAAWILKDADAAMCFTSPGLHGALSNVCDMPCVDVTGSVWATAIANGPLETATPRDAEDLCWLFYTSGTTGRPKGVMITNRMLVAMALSYFADVDEVTGEDCALYAAPMSHGAGIYNVMHVLKGARHVLPVSGGFEEAEIFALARHHGRVHMFAAPTMVKRLTMVATASGESGEGLRTIVYGGGPMYVADIVEAVDHFGPIFVQIYGQGECPMCITALSRQEVSDRTHPRWEARLASVGRAQSVVEVAIADENGLPLSAGEVGEIMVRGDAVMPGYWRNEEATAKTVVDGWLKTGDVGCLSKNGFLTLKDRSKDMIISGGTNIYPREVEEALLTHPSVIEVSVVGRPHPEWGEDVVAFVVAKGEMDTAALDAHCLERIARFKRPKDYFALTELPKNNYGKVLKTELRKMMEDM